MAGCIVPRDFLPGAQTLPGIGNRIIRLQPLPGGVEQMHAPRIGVAVLRRCQEVAVNILRQSRRLYGCGPLKGAFSQPTMVQESAAAQTRAMRAQTAKNILPEMSNSDSHPGRAGGSPWGNSRLPDSCIGSGL